VLADDPSLTVRWDELNQDVQAAYARQHLRQPVRVVIDSQNRVTPQHRLIAQPGETWLARQQPDEQKWPDNVEQFSVPSVQGRTDLVALLMLLGRRQINTVWVEAGAELAGALLAAGVVDELIVYLAPKLLGDGARGLCHLPALAQLAEAPTFIFSDSRQVGPDLRLTLTPR